MISEKNFDISLNPTNLFTSDVPIKGKAYCRIFIDVVGEGSWEIVSDNTYDIINDVIVFPVQPSGKYLSLQVSTTPAELTQSPTENSMILTIKNEIKKVADNMENVISLNDTLDVIVPNITKVGVVADNILDVNKVATDITKVGVVATDITKVGVVADNILDVNAVGDNIPKVINVDANMTKISNVDANMTKISDVDANMTKISNVDANMAKISNVDANMTDINNAEENAQLALQYKNLAQKWASELEDVVVADGKFSAYHWALKAYQLVTEGVINDITSSTTTTYSSDKLDDLLALKANLLNPIFSKSASIGGATLSSWGNTYSVVEGISGSFYGNDGLNTIIGNNAYFDGTNWRYKANGKATLQILSADNHVFNTTLSGSADGVITWNIVATLSNDNVLVPYIQNQIDNINTKLSNHVSLSGVTAYHLLGGNLSVDATVLTNGFGLYLYTGNTTTLPTINLGMDITSQWGNTADETYGYLIKIKSRSAVGDWTWVNSVRGSTKYISSNTTAVEGTDANMFTLSTVAGVTTLNIGTSVRTNTNGVTYVVEVYQTTHKKTGVTNQGKSYNEHYNPDTGFTINGYEGSGLAGHEIPHSLDVKLGFITFKNLSAVVGWPIYIPELDSNSYLYLNTNDAKGTGSATDCNSSNVVINHTLNISNVSTNQYIMFGWRNSYFDESGKLIGNFEIGTYQGTGVAGNKVQTRGKPAWVMLKRLDASNDWVTIDNQRGNNKRLYLNTSVAEPNLPETIVFNDDGFTLNSIYNPENASGGQYLYMVVYDNDNGSGKSKYYKATDTANVQINNGIIPLAHGIDSNGSKNSIVVANETITGVTYTEGKNYLYRHDTGYGVKSHSPRYLKSDLVRTYPTEQPDYFDVTKNTWYNTLAVSELVTNGTFNTNTTGWTPVTSTLTVVNGSLVITNVGTNYGSASQTINTTIGKKYTLKVSVDSGTSTASFDFTNGTTSRLYNAISGHYETTIDFIAQAVTVTLNFVNASNVAGQISYAQNISMFETNIMIGSEITESRNYMNHIVHADADGGVLYVEELPKIEYKNVIKAEEYLGKNACTALISAKCDIIPVIIENAVNFSAVVRTSTGVHEFYFDEPMDNLGYSVSIASVISGASAFVPVFIKYLNKVVIHTYASNSVMMNASTIDIHVFGGRN